MSASSLCWFRDDLRLADNPALAAAVAGGPTLCLYVFDTGVDRRAPGGAARWWLSRSLSALADDIAARGGELLLMAGDPAELVPFVARESGVDRVFWNRRYEAAAIALDTRLKALLTGAGREVESFMYGRPLRCKVRDEGRATRGSGAFMYAACSCGPFS